MIFSISFQSIKVRESDSVNSANNCVLDLTEKSNLKIMLEIFKKVSQKSVDKI